MLKPYLKNHAHSKLMNLVQFSSFLAYIDYLQQKYVVNEVTILTSIFEGSVFYYVIKS